MSDAELNHFKAWIDMHMHHECNKNNMKGINPLSFICSTMRTWNANKKENGRNSNVLQYRAYMQQNAYLSWQTKGKRKQI